MITHATIKPFVDERWVSAQRHPELPLTIYNYTHRTQFAGKWTDVTKACRGLILHDDGRVIARPFPKFFNLGEMAKSWNPPSKNFTVTTKEDGSLGILYRTTSGYAMATRGSFTGIQAIKATAMVQHYADLPWDTERYTYLFEVIYPENRIVVDYGSDERLVLLAVIDTATGKDVALPDWFPHHVQRWPELTDLQQLHDHAIPNSEGFVICFANGFRVKVKFAEYVRLHRLLTGVNARTIWEHLSAGGEGFDALITKVPDEFYAWVQATANDLRGKYVAIEDACGVAVARAPQTDDRRELAAYMTQQQYPAVCFAMIDEKDYGAIIWKLIKPSADRPFREDEA